MKPMTTLAVAGLMLGTVVSAQAAIMTATYTDSFGTTAYNFTDTLSVQQFDGSLGTLQSVELSYTFDVTSTAGVENFSANPGSATLEQTFTITLSNGVLGTLLSDGDTFSKTEAVGTFDGTPDFAGPSGFSDSVAPTFADTVSYTNALILAAFTGLGNFDFDIAGDVDIDSSFVGSGVGFLAQQWDTSGNGEISVTYTYDTPTAPIPSPAAVWAGLVLAGSAVMRRRNKK